MLLAVKDLLLMVTKQEWKWDVMRFGCSSHLCARISHNLMYIYAVLVGQYVVQL